MFGLGAEKLKIDTRPKTIRKPKQGNQNKMKSLDLTITDNEIKNIIENNNNSNNSNISKKKKEDPKLKMFLDAFKRV